MTSEKTRRKGGSLARSFNVALVAQVASLAESRVCEYAAKNPDFLRAFEGGQHDCGLYLGSKLLGGTLTDRLYMLQDTEDWERESIIPMDVKNPGPIADHKGSVFWVFHITQEQVKRCQVLLISSPKAPDSVTLLPMHYHRIRSKTLLRGSDSYRPSWTTHPLPAFPPEWSPFVMHISKIADALANMREYANGTIDTW
jgi:hypothetical protein